MLRVLLVDDEPLAINRLRVALTGLPDVQVVGEARDGDAACELIARLKPDVAVLDIQMPRQTGLSVAAACGPPEGPEVIFVTAYDQYAPEAFEVEAADYLLKPVNFDRLRVAVARAGRRLAARRALQQLDQAEVASESAGAVRPAQAGSAYDEDLWVPSTRGMMRVPIGQLVWIEAARDYVVLHTGLRSLILRQTISGLAERLDPSVMARVHRSTLVRLACVTAIRRQGKGLISLELEGEVVVPVGPSYTKAVQQHLAAAGRRPPGTRDADPS
jgi:DNA-binding LytR/AlgR family response regulator